MSQLQDLQTQIAKYEQAAQQAGLQTPQGQALYQNICRMKQKLIAIQNGSSSSNGNLELLQTQNLRQTNPSINHVQQTTQHLVKAITELKEQLSKIKTELSRPNLTLREKEELEKEHNDKITTLNAYHIHIQKASQQLHQMQQIQNLQGQESSIQMGNMFQGTPIIQKVQPNQATMNMTMQQRALMQSMNQIPIQAQQIQQTNKNQSIIGPTIQPFRQNPITIPKTSSIQSNANLPFQPSSGKTTSNTHPSSFEKMPPIPEVLNVKPPIPVSIPPPRPTLTSGYTTTPFMSTPGISKPPQYDIDNNNRILSKRKLQELVKQINPDERLDPDLLLEVADEFVESVVSFACRLAKYRKSDTLDVKDVQLHLERNWNIRIPGYTSGEIRIVRKNIPYEDGIDKTSLKEIWKGQKGFKYPEWSRWISGLRSPVTNNELYTLASSLKSKSSSLKYEKKTNFEENYHERHKNIILDQEDLLFPLLKQHYNHLSPEKTNDNKRSFFKFPEIKPSKKEHIPTLEHDLKTSNPPTFIDMYGRISENSIKTHSTPIELFNKNMYQKNQSSLTQEFTKHIYSESKTDLLLSKLLDCFSKLSKILETKGIESSKYSTPITKTHHLYPNYAYATSPVSSNVSPEIFIDAKENFSSNSIEKHDTCKLQKGNIKLCNKHSYSNYSGMHCLCQKISLKQSLFPPNTSPCNLYTIKNAKNYNPQRCHYEPKYINHSFEKKIQISPPKDIISQINIYPFTPFINTKTKPKSSKVSQDDSSPDFIVKKEFVSPFLYQTKTNYSALPYCKPMINEKDYTDKQYNREKPIQNESLKIGCNNRIDQKGKIPSFKEKKKDDILSINNNTINQNILINDLFDTLKQENKTHSTTSASSVTNLNKTDISGMFQTKTVSKNKLETILNSDTTSERVTLVKKNATSIHVPINKSGNTYFTEKKSEKKGKIRIPSIFLNSHNKTPLPQCTPKTLELVISPQNIKTNKENIYPEFIKSKNINKKENSKPLNSANINANNNSNDASVSEVKETSTHLYQTHIKKERKVSKHHTTNLNTQNLNTIQNIENSQKNKSFPQIQKKKSEQFKKSVNNCLPTMHNISTVDLKSSKNNEKIQKRATESSFNTRCKIIIPPIFLLQKNNDYTNNNIDTFKKSSLHTVSSNSTLSTTLINEKKELYNKKPNKSIEKSGSLSSHNSKKVDSLINTEKTCARSISFSRTKLKPENDQNKSDSIDSNLSNDKHECKNNLKINVIEPSNLIKTKGAYSKINIPACFSNEDTNKSITENVLPCHKYLVSAYQEAIHMSEASYKAAKIDALNKTQPNKIIIPSIFTMS
ncbi:hypothetical protein PCANB_002860 [Pneumocystis canis]|nr:hypothetical protein PCANB_002860 [Pneumocystis canis]